MPRVCRYARLVEPLAQRLAERTLELVDIPSESLHEAEVRAHLLSLVPAAFEAEYAAEDAFVFARQRRPGVPLVLLVGHYDTVPAQGNLPGRIADGAVHGCGATDMKGGVAVAVELVRELARSEPGPVRRRAAPLRQGGAAGAVQPPPRPVRALAARAGGRPRDPARADRPDDPGRLPRQPERAPHVLWRQRPLRPSLDGRERDRQGDRGAGTDRGARAEGGDRRRATLLRGRLDHPVRGRDRVERDSRPGRCDAELPLPARPHARGSSRVPPRPHSGRRRARDHRRLAARRRRHRHAARPRAARRGRPPIRAQAGLDERGRLHDPRHRRDQLRARARRATPTAGTSSSRSTRS